MMMASLHENSQRTEMGIRIPDLTAFLLSIIAVCSYVGVNSVMVAKTHFPPVSGKYAPHSSREPQAEETRAD